MRTFGCLVRVAVQGQVAQGGSRVYDAKGMAGRYVYVRVLMRTYLTICEVEVQ